jgi:hypothetical protein
MFVRASFGDPLNESDADSNRFDIVTAPEASGIKLLREYVHSDDDSTKRFAAFTLANLTMSERCKQKLFADFGFQFFLNFPSDLISQRTCALCLSELLEDDQNREAALEEGIRAVMLNVSAITLLFSPACVTVDFSQTLKRLTKSRDDDCKYLAVKSLSLIATCAGNRELLLCNGVLESLYDASKNSNTQTAKAAWSGMKELSKSPAKVLEYAQRDPPAEFVIPAERAEVLEYSLFNRRDRWTTVRLDVSIRTGKVFYEFALATEGIMQLGWAAASWKPSGQNQGVGDDEFSYGIDGNRSCGWYRGSVPASDVVWKTGSRLTIFVDMDKGEISFRINGEAVSLVFHKEGSTFDWADGLVVAASFTSNQGVTLNVGNTETPSKTEGFMSITEYARTHGLDVPALVELFDYETSEWVTPTASSRIVEYLEDSEPDEVKRARVVTWILFILTMDKDDNFFSAPVVEESLHPYR